MGQSIGLAKKRHDINMTEGSIALNLIRFAFPLLLGQLFQQLYNMVDTWVIGTWGLDAEYAAVGNVGPITNLMIGLFAGFSGGAGVVISQYYGAGDKKKVHDTVHTCIVVTLILAVVFTIVGILITPALLRLMFESKTGNSEIFPYAKTYLTIYFSGIASLLIYNIGAGILRAVGDSKRPFYFLLASATTNMILDVLFVVVFDMGVAGVAIATVIAQCVSATLTIVVLLRANSEVRVIIKDLAVDIPILKKIIKIGVPQALQLAVTAFSNVFVQSYVGGINPIAHQTEHLAAWTTYSKLDAIMFLPPQALAIAASTFVGQNLGAGNVARAKKGAVIAFVQSLSMSALIMIPMLLFAPYLAMIFNKTPLVVEYASILLRALTPFYLLCSINQVFSGALRGAGNSRAPMFNIIFSLVIFRQIYLFVMTNYISNDLIPVAMSYPAGWILCSIMTLITYFTCRFDKGRVIDK